MLGIMISVYLHIYTSLGFTKGLCWFFGTTKKKKSRASFVILKATTVKHVYFLMRTSEVSQSSRIPSQHVGGTGQAPLSEGSMCSSSVHCDAV